MVVHATPDDLQAAPWSTTAANAARLLYSASLLVDEATVTAVYAVDGTGTPTDATVAAALKDATCAQAATWAALGIDPAKGPADPGPGVVSAKSLGSASISYARPTQAADHRAAAATGLADDARRILAAAGLLSPVLR